MKKIHTLEETGDSGLPGETVAVVRDLLARTIDEYARNGYVFTPEEDGHVLVIEEGDTDADVRAALGATLPEAVLEGCVLDRGHFVALVLFNNQFGVSVVVEDAHWLPVAVRDRLIQNL